jgi:3-hydroxybutyryl-CoA dehydrogenase
MSEIKNIGVIGAGQMGRGIAQVAAFYGFKVMVYDLAPASLDKAHDFIMKQINKGIEKGKYSEQDLTRLQGNLKMTSSLSDLANCDLIIEAATENKKIKFELFKQLDEICKPHTILASNTSSISITELAAQTKRPDLVAGMHFMNPVPVMKLVEGIKGLETSEETFEKINQCAQKMEKVFIKSGDMPGFVVNRILMPMINEACFALYEGLASASDIDQAMKLGTNQPMGPLTLADFIGLDTCLAIMEVLYDGFKDSKYKPCPLLKQYVVAGRLGKKSGRGFYQYE